MNFSAIWYCMIIWGVIAWAIFEYCDANHNRMGTAGTEPYGKKHALLRRIDQAQDIVVGIASLQSRLVQRVKQKLCIGFILEGKCL